MNKKVILTVILVVYVIILFLGAFVIRLEDAAQPGSDKVLHFIGFFILTLLLVFSFNYYKLKKKILVTFVVALLIGIIIELIQLSIPSRTFSFMDILVDIIGIVLALVLSWKFIKH